MRKFELIEGFDGKIPQRADVGSAGYDFYAPQAYIIPIGCSVIIQTGVKCKMNPDDVLLIMPRSSLGIKRGISLSNTIGVIDASYYNNKDNGGNIMIALKNNGVSEMIIAEGDRIAQGIFVKFGITEEDTPIEKTRKGGIGSSGK